jgi:hypothetical protein
VTGRGWQRTDHGPDGVTIAPPDGGMEIGFRRIGDEGARDERVGERDRGRWIGDEGARDERVEERDRGRRMPDNSPTTKNRIHLDLNPTDRDQDAELRRLLALGATPVDVGQRADSTWHVLADPEGNVFCLCRDRADP